MIRAARDRRVFVWEEPIWHEKDALPSRASSTLGMHMEIVEETPTLCVIRPHITWGIDFAAGQRALLEELIERFRIRSYVCWYYTPMSLAFSDHLQPKAVVYDCMDELTGFLNAPANLAEREQQLFAATDVVFTGGMSLFEAKKSQHLNVHAFPSSIDVAHFAQAKQDSIVEPEDQRTIPHPRAGFYGVIDERLDLALLQQVAELRPRVQFVMIGPVVKIESSRLPQAKNIHYLGGKSYNDLPAYISGLECGALTVRTERCLLALSHRLKLPNISLQAKM